MGNVHQIQLLYMPVQLVCNYLLPGISNHFPFWCNSAHQNWNNWVKNTLQIGSIGSAVLNIGDNDSGLRNSVDGQVDLWANSKVMGYWNTTTFSFTGQIIPTNYSNFDGR